MPNEPKNDIKFFIEDVGNDLTQLRNKKSNLIMNYPLCEDKEIQGKAVIELEMEIAKREIEAGQYARACHNLQSALKFALKLYEIKK
jgi:hypothetical protein